MRERSSGSDARRCSDLQIHDWVLKAHAGWLEKHPKGFIPDLAECSATDSCCCR
jgi:hypothetical protein